MFAEHNDSRIPRNQAVGFGRSFVIVNVGEGEANQSFAVHETLICARSKFFEEAMSGKWKGAEEKMVYLTEHDPIAFGLYEQLIYTGQLPIKLEAGSKEGINDECVALSTLYVLAEKLEDTEIKHIAIDALLCLSRKHGPDGKRLVPGFNPIDIIYGGTPGPCAARRMMVDFYT